ncbi:MAG: rhomboid family intramembrane serine protease [Desulfurococcaceae archaeon]
MFIPVSSAAPRRKPFVTILLLLVNVVVFILMYLKPSLILNSSSVDEVQRKLAFIPVALLRGDRLWTLITCMFVHGDIFHLISNMIFLLVFGSAVEGVMGHRRFIIFYILCGLSASLFHILSISIIPQEFILPYYSINPWVTPVIGASGAISGVLGAYLIYYPRSKMTVVYPIILIPLIITIPAWVYVLIWFTIQLFLGMLVLVGYVVSSIAYWAHIGGFLTGVALSPLFMSRVMKMRIKYLRMIEKFFREPLSLYVEEEF